MFEHVVDYRGVIRALLGSNAEAVVRRHIHSALIAVIGQEVKMELQRRKRRNSPVSPELLTHFLVSTYISVLIWWLNLQESRLPETNRCAVSTPRLARLASIFG
jgi:hypothetical protein